MPIKYYNNSMAILSDNQEYLGLMGSNSIDLILTDPPYKDYQSNRPVVNPKQKKILSCNFDLPFFVKESFRLLKPSCHFYCFCDHKTFPIIRYEIEKYFNYINCIVWVKNNHGSGDLAGDYAPQHEFIIYASKGKRKPLNPPRIPNVLYANKVNNMKFGHGTVKPVELLKKFIQQSSNKGDLVLDPYAGTFSTAVACIELERDFIVIEKEVEWYNIGCDRITSFKTI